VGALAKEKSAFESLITSKEHMVLLSATQLVTSGINDDNFVWKRSSACLITLPM
jgi:hypothetical protein